MRSAEGQQVPAEALAGELLEGMSLPAFLLDRTEQVVAANAGALALLGQALPGRNLAFFLRAAELFEAITAVRADGEPRDVVLRLPGETQYEARVSLVQSLGQVLCVLRDISRETQNEVIRRDFVANVSHELRTPLTAMMGFIETLQTTAKGDPAAHQRFLSIMEREAARMNRLVSDLLQLSRVEASERMRPREEIDLVQVLQSVIATVRGRAEEAGGSILLERPEALETLLPGDADQLTQVFLNLTENAVKYGAKGALVRLVLSREMTSRGRALRVDVIDQGEGIDPVHLPRLTERFYRIDSHRSRAEGGTGLGLAIVKHIINRHRGWLKIDSRQGEGSTFTVLLPQK
ncbi:sensor histidine kinase [Pseudogemmobacter faecipullorum]|uniref:histidine kinase n=1 Tax=Pseudogemmobacter faecipullorum TaxID=2755041 RepID=A0ABS8CL53_9RHOB|nr:ATP-binding protein [Pseudogemmobacter faecipullorum]MCB5410081.1 two-component sensor histidine kinase [Pseudogemmobacter faecipullorum]